LQTSVEHLEGGRARLTITVPAADVDAAVAAAYAEVGSKLRIPGFRPGKAPRPVVDTHVGRETVLAEAQESVVTDSYGRTISEHGLRTIGQPDVGELELVEPSQDYTYTAEVALRPELSLSGIEDLTIAVPSQRSSDREIDAQINHTRERFATLESVERPIEAADFAVISFTGTVDGEPYEGNSVDRYLYELGRGLMPEEFDQALVGVAPGGSSVAEFPIPETSANEEFVGKSARFEIEVHEVKAKIMPPLDDEFATTAAGFDTLEEYRADVREKLDSAKATGHDRRVEIEALRLIADRLEGEVPEEMVDSRAGSMLREFLENLESRGISPQQYIEATGAAPEQIEADIKEQAAVRVREELALEALFRMQSLEVTDADVTEAIVSMSGGDEVQGERMRESLTENGVLPLVREQLVHQKALAWLLDAVTVIEEEPS
jgi:trigger factor